MTMRRHVHTAQLVTCLCAVAVLLLGLSSCSIGAPITSASTARQQGLTVWVMQDDFSEETLHAINTEFTQQTGIAVHVQVQPWDSINTKLTTALASSTPPDVIDIGNTKILDFAMSGGLRELTSSRKTLQQGNTWLAGLAQPAEYNGKLYAIPAFAATRAMIVNTAMWQEAGVHELPHDYEALTDTLTQVQQHHADNPNFSALYIPGQHWFSGMQFIWDWGGTLAKEEGGIWKGAASDPTTRKALRTWATFQRTYSASYSQSAAPNNPDQAQVLAQGQASAIWWNSMAATKAIALNPSLSGKLAVLPMPSMTSKANTSKANATSTSHATSPSHTTSPDVHVTRDLTMANADAQILTNSNPISNSASSRFMPSLIAGSCWSIPARSPNDALAQQWIRIATSEHIQRKWIVEHDGWLPNTQELLESFLQSGTLNTIQRGFFETALTNQTTPVAPGWSTLESDGSLRNLFAQLAQHPERINSITHDFDNHANDVFAHSLTLSAQSGMEH